MTSLVNPYNINGNYPIAGQDNDSQGFRDNFTNIKNNFIYAKSDIEDLQSKVVLKTALNGTTLDNNFLGSQVSNIQTKNQTETVYDWGTYGTSSGVTEVVLDFALGNIHKINAIGSIKINSVIKNWPSALQFSRLLLYISIDSVAHTLELPSSITTDMTSIPGLRSSGGSNIITFTDAGNYIFEFSSVASGSPIFVREITKGNPVFRDPNFYMAGIGAYTRPSLFVGYGNLIAVGSKIDSTAKGGTDTLSIRGSMTAWSNYADDIAYGGNNTPFAMTQAGFTVAKSRTVDQGVGVTNPVEVGLSTGDFIGYYNALGYTRNLGDGFSSYQQFSSIGTYATGSGPSLGGNIVMFTKQDGGILAPAVSIDNAQNVVIYGNLDVKGTQTIVESTVVTVKDTAVIVAQNNTFNSGGAGIITANASGIGVDQVWANIFYITDTSLVNLYNAWNVNKPFIISANPAGNAPLGAVPASQNAGALVVYGGATLGGNLNVGGSFGLTSTTDATTLNSAAFALSGGMAAAKNIIAGGNLFGNSSAFINGSLTVGGNTATNTSGLIINANSPSTSTASGALVVTGGAGIAGNVYLGATGSANGVVVSSTLNVSGTMLTDSNATARSATAALQVAGGSRLLGNVVIGTGTSTGNVGPGRVFIDNAQDATLGAITTGGLVLGNSASRVGMSISGSFNLGTTTGGTLYIMNQNPAQGTPTGLSIGIASASSTWPTPFAVTQYSGSQAIYGGFTNAGGSNLFGNVYIGQPHDGTSFNSSTGTWSGSRNGSTGKPIGSWSGNLYLLSGAISNAFNQGALVIPSVLLADGSQSDGGMGVAGNVYMNQAVFAGYLGNSSTTYGNLVAASSVESTSSAVPGAGLAGTANGSFVALGGASVVKRLNVQGNVIANSGTLSTSLTTGALVITNTGGMAVQGNINVGTSIQFTSNALLSVANLSAIEYNSPVAGTGILYGTPAQNSRALLEATHLYAIQGNASLNTGTPISSAGTLYGAFGGSTGTGVGGALNVVAGTAYEIDIKLVIGHSGGATASSTMSFTFGGTATFNSYNYEVMYIPSQIGDGTVAPSAGPVAPLFTEFASVGGTMPTITTGIVTSANTLSNKTLRVRGIIRITNAGTLLPQIGWATAPGNVVQAMAGSYFKLTPIGASTVTQSIGSFTT